jgi:hypothetical protein
MIELNLNGLFQLAAIGLFTGFGSSIGNYLAQRSFIRHLDKINMLSKVSK